MGNSSEYENYFNMWLKSQEQVVNSWMDAVKGMQQVFTTAEKATAPVVDTGNGNGAASSDPFEVYRSWLTSTAMSLSRATSENVDTFRDTLARSLNGSNVYAKLYQVWIPIVQAMQQRPLDTSFYANLLDPARYKEVLDEAFGFNVEATARLYDQALSAFQAINSTTTDFLGPWASAAYKNTQLVPQAMLGRPESVINMYRNLMSAFDKTFGAALRTPAVGKDRERIELSFKALDDLAAYMSKNAEYQLEIYLASLSAMERVMEAVASKISQGELKDFNEVFNLWVAENERQYLELSKTDEFSKLQGELLNTGLQARQSFFKLAELYLEDFPVAVRSEMDDLYKTIYELKKRVRDLEKQVKAVSAGEAKA